VWQASHSAPQQNGGLFPNRPAGDSIRGQRRGFTGRFRRQVILAVLLALPRSERRARGPGSGYLGGRALALYLRTAHAPHRDLIRARL
jgi:hypothetical protein